MPFKKRDTEGGREREGEREGGGEKERDGGKETGRKRLKTIVIPVQTNFIKSMYIILF